MRTFRHLVVTGLAIVVVATAASAPAAEPRTPQAEAPKAEAPKVEITKAKPLDGKELFKTNCKVCHAAKAEAGEYTPMTLIQEQWEEFFAVTHVEVHGAVVAPGETGKMVTDVIDGPMLEAIRKFCVDHAADSEQPMTCG